MATQRIMVVDGSGVSRELVARQLANTLQVTACGGGREALERLTQERYQLVVTAPVLADMDGLELCRAIRQSHSLSNIPIIFITGDSDPRLFSEGFAAGVSDFFDKSRGYPALGAHINTFSRYNSGAVGRVLYVEDSHTAAAITRRALERQGLQIAHVTSAEEALQRMEQMREGAEHYDLVITDFHLEAAMTGGDLLRAIRLHYGREELPVLLMSGQDDLLVQVELIQAGANDLVHKPLVEEVLVARVRSMLLIHQMYSALATPP